MAEPARRKKGKKLVGNFRQPLPGGGDVNLETQDAIEAKRRGRLAVEAHKRGVRGADLRKAWSPGAAAAAAVTASDPARGEEAAAAAKGSDGGTPPAAAPPPPSAPPPSGAATPAAASSAAAGAPVAPDVSDDDAAAAAAAEVVDGDVIDGAGATAPSSARARFEAMVKGAKGGDSLVAMVADMFVCAAMWVSAKGGELGWDLLLTKWTKKRIEAGELPAVDSWEREFSRVALQLVAEESFPKLLDKVTPGVGLGLGILVGAGRTLAAGRLVDVKTNQATPVMAVVGDAMAAAASMANGAPAPQPAPPA